MEKESKPFCSVVVLNYFGEKVIGETVRSLLELAYPKEKYEIIIVDNNSQDESRKIITSFTNRYDNIKPIFLKKNLGFAKGNNVGVRAARGRYVILLNNDCVVEKRWLDELVKTANRDNKIFAVNSKILLYPKFFYLKLKKPVYTALKSCHLYRSSLFRFDKREEPELAFYTEDNHLLLEIPYDPMEDGRVELRFLFHKPYGEAREKTRELDFLNIGNSSYRIKEVKDEEHSLSYQIELDLKKRDIVANSFSKVQNAGIVVFQNGGGRDIGALVRYHQQDYEGDLGQYDKEKEVYAACAGATLYRKKILDKIGLLDESFFMYYEDDEISERARLKGYKIVYCPGAVARHLHAFSSEEGSLFFLYHTRKGRLLHVFFHFPLRVVASEFATFTLHFIRITVRDFFRFLVRSERFRERFGEEPKDRIEEEKLPPQTNTAFYKINKALIYLRILSYFAFNFPLLMVGRIRKHQGLERQAVEKNYQKILAGYWYFN